MAILKGLTVSIEVNGKSLHEYRDHDVQEVLLDSISKYIESASGAAFAFRVYVPQDFSFTSDALGVFLYLDGSYIESGIFEKGSHDYRFKGTFGVGEGGEFGYLEFTFDTIEFEDFSKSSGGEDLGNSDVAILGTIIVQIFRMHILGPRIKDGGSRTSTLSLRDDLQVSKKDLKGTSVTHNVKLGAFKPSTTGRDALWTEVMDAVPLASFRFKYCSRRALQALLLIPPTPIPPRSPSTPAPLDQRPLQEPNAAEKDERARRQQVAPKRKRKSRWLPRRQRVERARIKARGIKRERDGEYDEMMASASAKRVRSPVEDGEIVED